MGIAIILFNKILGFTDSTQPTNFCLLKWTFTISFEIYV